MRVFLYQASNGTVTFKQIRHINPLGRATYNSDDFHLRKAYLTINTFIKKWDYNFEIRMKGVKKRKIRTTWRGTSTGSFSRCGFYRSITRPPREMSSPTEEA
ncbi:hypothetical protein QJS10_CPB11g00401 [Acorus calamus]|uniref:Uncharacterized protein n=1 Tax=Acorus calamus TaxID=4465 RepID=A0AAV9DR31_ACOCL|nr:hypothetical protein QJS10_CPB11g00401 [Acorus calamus]